MFDSVDLNGDVLSGGVSSASGTTETTDVLTLLGSGGSIEISEIETVLGSSGIDAVTLAAPTAARSMSPMSRP